MEMMQSALRQQRYKLKHEFFDNFPYTWLRKLLLSNQLVMNSGWLLWSHGKLPKNGNFPEPNFFAFTC
jgi:hypothetical protein